MGTPISPISQDFVTNSPPPIPPADLQTTTAENPRASADDLTMTPVGQYGVPDTFGSATPTMAPKPSPQFSAMQPSPQAAQPQAANAQAIQPPPKKGSLGISLIRHIAEALGGSGSEIDPNTGKPVRTSTGALVTQAIGRFGGSVAAGLENSRGPGGATRAAASAFQKQQEFSAEEQQRRYNAMESYRATARQIASLRHQNLGDTKLQQELYENNKAWIESAVDSGGVMANEGGNPVNDTEAKKLFGDLVKSGYSPGSIMMFLGPPQPAAGDPAKTEQTYFLVTPSNKDGKLTINPNADARADLSKDLGVKVADQQIPPHVLANLLANKTAISTSIEKSQQELTAAGIKDVPRAQVDLGNMRQAMIATQAMKNWQMVHSPYGDVFKDLQTFAAKYPGPGAAWLSENLYGGKEKEISNALATKNMTPEQKVKFETDQNKLEESKVDLQKKQLEFKAAPAKDDQENQKRNYEIEDLKIKVAAAQAEADGKKPVPDPQGRTGEDYISILPPDMQQTVRDIGNGQIALSRYDYLMAKNPQLMYAVANAYPNQFDTSKAIAFVKERERFEGGGDVGKLLNNMGAMAEHARTAYDIVSKHPVMSLGGQFTEAGTDYKGAVGALSDEVAAFLKGGGAPTDIEQKFWRDYLNPTAFYERPAAIREVVNRLVGKYHEFESQWEKALPNPKMVNMNQMPGISDQALNNLRYVSNRGVMTIDVKAPNGKIYQFNNQQQADAFKKSAGIQ